MFNRGDCFWIETNYDNYGYITSHLYVIALKFAENRIVIVNFDKTCGKHIFDRTVIIEPSEDPSFFTEQSFVNYYRSEVTTEEDLQYKISHGIAKNRGVLNPNVVEKVCEGVLRSEDSPFEVREPFEDLLFGSL
jgi:hypothetical protein